MINSCKMTGDSHTWNVKKLAVLCCREVLNSKTVKKTEKPQILTSRQHDGSQQSSMLYVSLRRLSLFLSISSTLHDSLNPPTLVVIGVLSHVRAEHRGAVCVSSLLGHGVSRSHLCCCIDS